MEQNALVNKTIRAVIVIAVMLFSIGIIVFNLHWGDPHNSLHSSSLAWAFSLLIFTLIALGIDSAAVTIVSTMIGKTTVVAQRNPQIEEK